MQGLAPRTPWLEWVAQAAWAALWLLTLETSYGALLGALTSGASHTSQALGAPLSWRSRLLFIATAVALLPLSVVAETWTQWAVNSVLYDPNSAVPTYLGWFRGLIDSRDSAAHLATTADTLSPFARDVLGWREEMHPFALVICAPMIGNVLWAALAMAIGNGALRRAAPVLARAFCLAGLQAATAPLFTLGYFFIQGGDGLNVWSDLLRVLAGTVDAEAQVPMWIRVVGVSVFFLLPVAAVVWRVRVDRREIGAGRLTALGGHGPARAVTPSGPRATLLASALVVPMIAVWIVHLSAGPWSWLGQSVWLALWLGWLAACQYGVRAAITERRGSALAQTRAGQLHTAACLVVGAWLLAIAGCVVQVTAQWLVATLEGGGVGPMRFFGWFLGQVTPLRGQPALAPTALVAAFLGNALWAYTLLGLAALAWREQRVRTAQTLGLGALQAATAPLALCAFMILSIITRDRVAAGWPRYDVWHVWTYVARAAADASYATEVIPLWPRLIAAALLIGLPCAVAHAWFAAERQGWKASRQMSSGPVANEAPSMFTPDTRALPALAGRRVVRAQRLVVRTQRHS